VRGGQRGARAEAVARPRGGWSAADADARGAELDAGFRELSRAFRDRPFEAPAGEPALAGELPGGASDQEEEEELLGALAQELEREARRDAAPRRPGGPELVPAGEAPPGEPEPGPPEPGPPGPGELEAEPAAPRAPRHRRFLDQLATAS